ncbi:MAG TPA: hypothetical protein PK667_13220 [Nitrosomonas europaea]|uniref:hypothetical protein n=1 Tax=Nitrosomonas europaea TaxID=915 RepID=UPI002D163842|nr:hypothetical protein [Nitrosomonas europaea]HRO57527.1 hypothetical protein [Nitrosomonas europaea]HUM75129.1 hypothetical protein [Nitrosomonas europaea]
MGANVEIRQRYESSVTTTTIVQIGFRRQPGTRPWEGTAQGIVDIKHRAQSIYVWSRDKQLSVDHQIDVQWRLLATDLKLIHGPVVPPAIGVHAVDPNIGID